MIENLPVANTDGTIGTAPFCQLQLNSNQVAILVGLDKGFDPERLRIVDDPRITWFHAGKASEQNFILSCQLGNSLGLQGWDFEAYPDPEVFFVNYEGEQS